LLEVFQTINGNVRDRMVVGFTTTLHLYHQCLLPLMFWVWILLMARCTQ